MDTVTTPLHHPLPKHYRLPLNTYPLLHNELWVKVLDYCINQDFKSLRLVGNKWFIPYDLVSSLLFRTAYVAARRGVLQTLWQLMAHPVLRHCVTDLVYDTSWYDSPDDTKEIRNARLDSRKYESEFRTRLEEMLKEAFEEQEEIQCTELASSFQVALCRFTHLRKVIVADLSRTFGVPGDTYRTDSAELYICRTDSGSMFGQIGDCCLTRDNFECGQHKSAYRRQFGGVVSLLQALSSTLPPTFEDLILGDDKHSYFVKTSTLGRTPDSLGIWTGGIVHWLFDDANLFLPPIFHQLRKLDLRICSFPLATNTFTGHANETGDNRPLGPNPIEHNLRIVQSALEQADSLQELRLSGQYHNTYKNIRQILPLRVFKYLKLLRLQGFEGSLSDVEDLLHRHRYSLHDVTLDDFDLTQHTWRELGRYVRRELPDLNIVLGLVWQNKAGIRFATRYSFEGDWTEVDPTLDEGDEDDGSVPSASESEDSEEFYSDSDESDKDEWDISPTPSVIIIDDSDLCGTIGRSEGIEQDE